ANAAHRIALDGLAAAGVRPHCLLHAVHHEQRHSHAVAIADHTTFVERIIVIDGTVVSHGESLMASGHGLASFFAAVVAQKNSAKRSNAMLMALLTAASLGLPLR